MGQKVNPHGLRVGIIKDWDSKWYAEDDFSDFLIEDYNTPLRACLIRNPDSLSVKTCLRLAQRVFNRARTN